MDGEPSAATSSTRRRVPGGSLTANSDCPIHRSHKIRYCPDYGYIPGQRRGSIPDTSPRITLSEKQQESLMKAIHGDVPENLKVTDLV